MTPRLRAAVAGAATGVALFVAAFSAAAAPSRVVLLRTGGDTMIRQAETLLGAELRAVGFEVVDQARTAADLRQQLETAGADRRPIASLAIARVTDSPVVEVWLSDRLSGKLVIRRVDTPAASDATDLALKAVELLRGSLLEIAGEAPAPAPANASATPAPPPPEDVTRFVARGAPARTTFLHGFGVGLGGGLLASAQELSPSLAPVLAISYGSGRWGGRLTFVGPGSASSVQASDGASVLGTAQVRQELAVLEGVYVFRPNARLQPFVAAGGGVHHTRVQGTGGTPLFTGTSDATFGALGSGGAGLALRLGTRAALLAEVRGTAVFPGARVLIAGQEAARVGGPSVLATTGVVTTF